MYMLSLRRREMPGSFLPKDRLRVERFGEREFSPDGGTIYSAFCSGCHGANGMGRRAPGRPPGPAIAHPDFLELVSDRFLAASIRKGRPGRGMPAWGEISGGLRPEEIEALGAHLRRLGGVESKPESKPRRWVTGDPALGQRLYAASCSGCHGADGEGGLGPALNNQALLAEATDTFLIETIARGRRGTGMMGFLPPSPVQRALTTSEIESIVAFIRSWEETQP
jgi:cytochrome c oxidase cbb3-type subunit III